MGIVVKNLTKKFGDKVVLNGLNLTLDDKKTTVIMGKSGIGKTTVLNCIAGLLDYEGSILGVDGVAFVFQEDRLIKHLTVYENLDFALSGQIPKEERRKKIKEMLKEVELTEKASAYPEELSGGQKKRVSIARAFLSRENVLLMDEALNSLDLGLKSRMVELFINLRDKYQKTVVFVTHDIEDALAVADKISVIDGEKEVLSYRFTSVAVSRDIYSVECNEVRKSLASYLKN